MSYLLRFLFCSYLNLSAETDAINPDALFVIEIEMVRTGARVRESAEKVIARGPVNIANAGILKQHDRIGDIFKRYGLAVDLDVLEVALTHFQAPDVLHDPIRRMFADHLRQFDFVFNLLVRLGVVSAAENHIENTAQNERSDDKAAARLAFDCTENFFCVFLQAFMELHAAAFFLASRAS